MRKVTTRNILKKYNRYLRKLKYLLENDRKSTKIAWLKKRLLKIKHTIEIRINNYRLSTKKVVSTAFAVTAILATAQAQNFELKLNPANPFYEVVAEAQAKPHFVDFDGDGDDDLFVTGYISDLSEGNIRDLGLSYYENNAGAFTKKSIEGFPEDLGLSEITAENDNPIVVMDFIDFDGDGDLDAFAGVYEGTAIVYLENNEGVFSANDAANPFAGIVLSEDDFVDLDLGDIDGDGVIDAMVSDDGAMKIYKLDAGLFVEGETIVDGNQMSPSLFDQDGDGDLDLMIGNKYGSIDLYENIGGIFTEVENHKLSRVSLEYNPSLAFSDINNDGDVDALSGSSYGALSYFENVGEEYEFIPYNEKGIHFYGAASPVPEFADIDGDGDEDLLVGSEIFGVRYIENTEDGFVFNPAGNPFGFTSGINTLFTDPNCGDIDGDGDIDCHFISNFDGFENYFENVEGVYTLLDSLDNPIVEFSSEENSNVQFEDFDNDGDLDLFVSNKYGPVMYYENVEGAYVDKSELVSMLNQAEDSRIFFFDFDNDGDNDVIEFGPYGDTYYYEKDGTTLTVSAGDESLAEILTAVTSRLSFIDIDGDGDEDIFFADYRDRALFIENLAVQSSVESEVYSSETKISPNPASNEVNIEIPWSKGKVDVMIYNFNGQFVSKVSSSGQHLKLNASDLSNGNYTLKIVGESGQAIKKLTIIR